MVVVPRHLLDRRLPFDPRAQQLGGLELFDEVAVSVGENGAVLQKIYDCSVESVLHGLRQGPEVHGFSFLEFNDGLVPAT